MPNVWPKLYKKTTDRRKEWKALKLKHAAAIKASKIDFDANLGKAVDAFETQVKKMATEGYGLKSTTQSWTTVGTAATKLVTVAKSYQGKLGGLADPAKKALTAFLEAVETDGGLWVTAAQNPTPTEAGPSLGEARGAIFEIARELRSMSERSKQYLEAIIEKRTTEFQPDAGNPDPAHKSKADPERVAYLAALETQVDALIQAVEPARAAAKRLDEVASNARKDSTYVKVYKAGVKQAVAGPFATLKRELTALSAIPPVKRPKGDIVEASMIAILSKQFLGHLTEVEAAAATY